MDDFVLPKKTMSYDDSTLDANLVEIAPGVVLDLNGSTLEGQIQAIKDWGGMETFISEFHDSHGAGTIVAHGDGGGWSFNVA